MTRAPVTGMQALRLWWRRRAENVAAALLGAMFCAFMLQIVSRYVFNSPIGWTQEACLTTWLWVVFWGSAFTLDERDHVKFDVLYAMFALPIRRRLALISALAIAAGFLAALPATIDYITFYQIKSSATLGIRLDVVFSVYGIFALAMVVRPLLRAWQLARGADPDALDDIARQEREA